MDEQSEAGIQPLEKLSGFDIMLVTEASSLLHAVSSDSFLVAMRCNLFASKYLKGLSILLQGPHLDVIEAYSQISGVISLLQDHREKLEKSFHDIYTGICSMLVSAHDREVRSIPRLNSRQTQRCNISADTPEEYRRKAVFVPFLDSILVELHGCFSSLNQKSVQALLLLTAKLTKLSLDHVAEIAEVHGSDLPEELTFVAKLELWKKKMEEASRKYTPIISA